MKYLIIALSAFIIEICSTFYITFVADKNPIGMIIFAGIAPFLGLPFIGYMVESENWDERFKMAIAMSWGYMLGSIFVIFFILNS